MKTLFFSCPGENGLQRLYDQLPGMQLEDDPSTTPPIQKNINPGFASMEVDINAAKGFVSITKP